MLFALVCCLNNYNEALMPKVKIRQHTKERKKTKVVSRIRRKWRKLQCAIYFFLLFSYDAGKDCEVWYIRSFCNAHSIWDACLNWVFVCSILTQIYSGTIMHTVDSVWMNVILCDRTCSFSTHIKHRENEIYDEKCRAHHSQSLSMAADFLLFSYFIEIYFYYGVIEAFPLSNAHTLLKV